jgi:hypothetical protein
MRWSLVLGVAALFFPLAVAAPASAGFEGQYTVTFFVGPDHTQAASQCINFVLTGEVAGFLNSGYFTSPTAPIEGNFIVDGSGLRWYGHVTNKQDRHEIFDFHNQLNKNGVPHEGGYDDWRTIKGGVTAISDGIITLVRGCTAPVHTSRIISKE